MPGPGSASFSPDTRDPGGPEQAEDGESSLARGLRTTQGEARSPPGEARCSWPLALQLRGGRGHLQAGSTWAPAGAPVSRCGLGYTSLTGHRWGISAAAAGPVCVFLERCLFRPFARFQVELGFNWRVVSVLCVFWTRASHQAWGLHASPPPCRSSSHCGSAPEAQAFSTSVVSGLLTYFWSPVLLAFYLWNRRLIRDPLRFTRVFPSRRLVGSALKLRSSIHFKLISVYTEMASPTPWK